MRHPTELINNNLEKIGHEKKKLIPAQKHKL